MIGETLAHFRITAALGKGGMGEVYRAEDTKLGRQVAIKVLPEKYISDRASLARFEREARLVAALNHPNIVTLYSVEESGGKHFLAMELVEGHGLDKLLQAGPLTVRRLLDVSIQLADALAAAHARGIVHRDLKPGNVMVTRDGRVKVLDFGLAKLVAAAGDDMESASSREQTLSQPLTAEGKVAGTVPYMSPEQLEGRSLDHRTDIFSLGVILYKMATGQRPFQGLSSPSVMSAILRDTPKSVSDVRDELPVPLARTIDRCLEKDRDRRYQSAADVRLDLEALRRELESGQVKPPRRRIVVPRWAWWASAAVIVLGGVAAGVGLFTGGRFGAEPGATPVGARSEAGAFDAAQWVIAVMPSSVVSEDADLAALTEGLALTLTTRLAQLSRSHGLQIIPASTLREEGIDRLEEARRELGVTLVLTFDTRRSGDRVRVNAQLVDVRQQRQLVAETIDGTMDDLLDLEEKVTTRVLRMLQVELQPTERALVAAGTRNPEAHSFYLRASGLLRDYDEPAKVEAAVTLFREAVRVDPSYAQAHAGLGEALWRRYRLDGDPSGVQAALEECRLAVALDEKDAEGYVCLGTVHNGMGHYEQAAGKLELAKALDPTRDETFRGLADALTHTGHTRAAEAAYKEAIALRPRYWAGYNWLGIFYFQQGRAEEAVPQFEKVVELAPDSYRGYSNLGAAHYYAGRWPEARAAYEQALLIKPDDDLASSNLATLDFFEERYESAARRLEAAVGRKPNDPLLWGNLGDAYYWGPGLRPKAPEAYRRAVASSEERLGVNERDTVLRAELAYYRAMLGQGDEARRQLARALDDQPSDIEVLYLGSQIHELLGDRPEALRLLDRAIQNGYPKREVRAHPLWDAAAADPDFRRLVAGD
ncbi:MAG: protein kinase [Acidobacteria bacterium]|nr:protein kinase [Acidobacteriota bacterium]